MTIAAPTTPQGRRGPLRGIGKGDDNCGMDGTTLHYGGLSPPKSIRLSSEDQREKDDEAKQRGGSTRTSTARTTLPCRR